MLRALHRIFHRRLPTKMIPVLHFGLGPVGCNIARCIQDLKNVRSVGAVDLDSALLGRDLGDVLGLEKKLRCKVSDTLGKAKAKVALHATRSWLGEIEEEVSLLIRKRMHVISTAEEMVFPVEKNLAIARRLDRLAKKYRVVVTAAGVNPGFVLDYLPSLLLRVSAHAEHVLARRVVDLSTRRMQLQRKVGVGMTVAEFNDASHSPHFGHQGMKESLGMVAAALNVDLRRTYLSIKPIVAETHLSTEYFNVMPGQVAGLEQTAVGYSKAGECVRIEVIMRVGGFASEDECSYDEIKIQGRPPIHLRIPGGVAGEAATAAAAAGLISRVIDHAPGFYTPLSF